MRFLIEDEKLNIENIINETFNELNNESVKLSIESEHLKGLSFFAKIEDDLKELWHMSPFGSYPIEELIFSSHNKTEFLVEALFCNGKKKKPICYTDKLDVELAI